MNKVKKILNITIKYLKYTFFLIIVIFILSSRMFYSVDQSEYVILTTFGIPSKDIQTPGLKVKMPFGIQKIKRVSKKTFSTTIGYDNKNGEIDVNERDSKMITGDENIVLADIEVQWRVVDPIAFTYNIDKPELVISNLVSSSLRNVIGSSTVDEALTDGRTKIIESIKRSLIDNVKKYNLGIQIVNVNLQDIDLPTSDVDKAFKAVTDAREKKLTKINEAEKYKNEKLNEVVGKEASIISEAEAKKTELIKDAESEVAGFNALYKRYKQDKEITKQDMIFTTINEIYKNIDIIITDGSTVKYISLDEYFKGGIGNEKTQKSN